MYLYDNLFIKLSFNFFFFLNKIYNKYDYQLWPQNFEFSNLLQFYIKYILKDCLHKIKKITPIEIT